MPPSGHGGSFAEADAALSQKAPPTHAGVKKEAMVGPIGGVPKAIAQLGYIYIYIYVG